MYNTSGCLTYFVIDHILVTANENNKIEQVSCYISVDNLHIISQVGITIHLSTLEIAIYK